MKKKDKIKTIEEMTEEIKKKKIRICFLDGCRKHAKFYRKILTQGGNDFAAVPVCDDHQDSDRFMVKSVGPFPIEDLEEED